MKEIFIGTYFYIQYQYALQITSDQTVQDVDRVVGPVILSLGCVPNVMVRTTERIANTAVQGTASILHVAKGVLLWLCG